MSLLSSARSFLFLPADRLERLAKALASEAHAVILDLEDGVAPHAKDTARAAIESAWPTLDDAQRSRLLVRPNATTTASWREDSRLLGSLRGLGGVVVPKAETVPQMREVLTSAPGASLLPLIETAEGYVALHLLARAPGVARIAFGHLDFQADVGINCGADERELDAVRLSLVITSRRAALPPPVDGVSADLRDMDRLREDAARSRRFGFGGKLCIHPQQLAIVHEALAPSDAQRAWAARVLEASRQHGEGGAFQFEGAMVDAPVLARARQYLA